MISDECSEIATIVKISRANLFRDLSAFRQSEFSF